MIRNLVLSVLMALCLLAKSQDKPNIVFILADDMGYSDMSWQGSPIQTPNLDKLASGGMFLSRNYVQPQCTPTRIAFLTGNYPYRYGLHEHVLGTQSMHGIPSEEKTIAEKMKEGGYRTAVIGKWHVGCHLESHLPQNQGFDHSFICLHGTISYWNYMIGGKSTMVRNGKKYYAPSLEDAESSGNQYSTDMWRDEAVALITNHNQKQPLFLYLPFNAPHHPLHAPEKLVDKYRDVEIDPYWSGPDAVLGRTAENRLHYMAMVDAMDQAIGGVVEALKKADMLENTLIVFTSDNGGIEEGDNRPLRSYKGDSFEGGVRLPALAFWPGKISAGSKSSELVYVADWYATFAELAGLDTRAEGKDGISALDVLRGGKGQRDYIPIISAARHAYITGDYSLVGSGENYQDILDRDFSGFRLYDLNKDLSQTLPVSKNQAQGEAARDLLKLESQMKAGIRSHFIKTNRGNFNWDAAYSRYRRKNVSWDHDLDMVIDDSPEISVVKKGASAGIWISPVSEELIYTLQGSQEGKHWSDLAGYVCTEDAEKYRFPGILHDKKLKEYRVLTRFHYGLPIYDAFSPENAYEAGPLNSVPDVEGFLPVPMKGDGEHLRILDESLGFKGLVGKGGALELRSNASNENPVFTRYFVQPMARGKVFASMLLSFEGRHEESVGEINFLVQNGWNGPTGKQVTLSFQQDGIYLDKADPVPPHTRKWLGEHERKVVRAVFEFDLGPIGQDVLKVYINPPVSGPLPEPDAELSGELTFDRLQFGLTARTPSVLRVDEIRIARSLEGVNP